MPLTIGLMKSTTLVAQLTAAIHNLHALEARHHGHALHYVRAYEMSPD